MQNIICKHILAETIEKYISYKLVFSQDTEFEVYEVNVTEEDVKEAEQNIS